MKGRRVVRPISFDPDFENFTISRRSETNMATPRRPRRLRQTLAIMIVASTAIAWNTSFRAPPRYDGAGYSVLAWSLATGRGYRAIDHPDAPAHAHFPPAYPFALAAVWKVAGRSNFVAHAFSAGCFVAAAVATSLWFRTFLPRRAAFALSLAFALNWSWLRLGGEIRSESFYLMLCQFCLLSARRAFVRGGARSGIPLGGWLGASVLARQAGIGLAAAVVWDGFSRNERSRRAALAAIGTFAVVVAPWFLWLRASKAANQWELLPRESALEVLRRNLLFYMERIPDRLFGPLIEVGTVFRPRFAPIAIAFAAVVSSIVLLGWVRLLFRPRSRLAALVPLLTLPLLLIWPFTEAGRFLAPLVPSILVGAAEGLSFSARWFSTKRVRLGPRRAARLILAIGLPFSIATSRPGRLEAEARASSDFDAACRRLALLSEPAGPVLARHPGEVFWLSGRTALSVENIADLSEIDQIVRRYRVAFLLNDSDRYARAPESSIARYLHARKERFERVWKRGGIEIFVNKDFMKSRRNGLSNPQGFFQGVEGRSRVSVIDETRGKPDDSGGAETKKRSVEGGKVGGGNRRGHAPGGRTLGVPNLAAHDVRRALIA